MTQQEIQERSEQIALMVGHKISENKECFKLPNKNGWINLEIFHLDWGYLMEAVEFIEKLQYEFHGKIVAYISGNNCTIQGSKLNTNPENFHPALFMDFYGKDKQEAVFTAVSNFAKMFNNKEL
jgi:hypothetical protein